MGLARAGGPHNRRPVPSRRARSSEGRHCTRRKDDTMQYALLIFDTPDSYDGLDDDARQAITAEYMAIAGDDRVVGGAQLQPVETATTVRARDGERLVTDGPFADT